MLCSSVAHPSELMQYYVSFRRPVSSLKSSHLKPVGLRLNFWWQVYRFSMQDGSLLGDDRVQPLSEPKNIPEIQG